MDPYIRTIQNSHANYRRISFLLFAKKKLIKKIRQKRERKKRKKKRYYF